MPPYTAPVPGVPDYMAGVTVGEILVFLGGLAAAWAILWVILRPMFRAARTIYHALRDISGRPERKDSAGNTIEPAQPGIMHRLHEMAEENTKQNTVIERIRHQTENSHGTNLRDDLDGVRDLVRGLGDRLDSGLREVRAEYNANHREGLAENQAIRHEIGNTQRALDDHIRDKEHAIDAVASLQELARKWEPYMRNLGHNPDKEGED